MMSMISISKVEPFLEILNFFLSCSHVKFADAVMQMTGKNSVFGHIFKYWTKARRVNVIRRK